MNMPMKAIIKKDLKNILSDKRMFSAILMVPLIMTVVLPAIFMVAVYFGSDDPDLQQMLALLPQHTAGYDIRPAASAMIFNNIMPILFFIIPVMTASVMAASSFVGEKEKHTLETLLYCPLPVRQIFQAKIAASFFLSMLVSLISFTAMALVLETISYILMGILLMPGLNWLVAMLIISPAISLIAITLIVRGSAKAKSVEESQQRAVFIVIPVILLMAACRFHAHQPACHAHYRLAVRSFGWTVPEIYPCFLALTSSMASLPVICSISTLMMIACEASLAITSSNLSISAEQNFSQNLSRAISFSCWSWTITALPKTWALRKYVVNSLEITSSLSMNENETFGHFLMASTLCPSLAE